MFFDELNMVKSDDIRDVFQDAVEQLPDYFFTVAASSTGKYHPTYSLGNGGLVRHTKAAVKIAFDLLEREYYKHHFSQKERDCIIVALTLHDGWKHGKDGSAYTTADHPIVSADWFVQKFGDRFSDGEAELISRLIKSHMGEWNTAPRSTKEIMPKPDDELTMFVHMCDYLASRKWLTVEFETGKYYKPDEYEDSSSVDDLAEMKTRIVTLCKEKIAAGTDRESILQFIASKNDGRRNPMSINSIDVANEIYKELETF